ncbi:MAG: hypothetical protein AAGI91_17465 [Bacteroidota bacterium]
MASPWRVRRRLGRVRQRYRLHACADRWLPTLRGYRTIVLVVLGFALAVPIVQRTLALPDELFVRALYPLAVLMSVLLLSYPVSKVASGYRDGRRGLHEPDTSTAPPSEPPDGIPDDLQ